MAQKGGSRKPQTIASFQEISSSISSGKISNVYLLGGEEPFFIDRLSEQLLNTVLEEHQREFDQDVVYGQDINAGEVIEMARQFPMTGEKRLVVVKEAQGMDDLGDLESYFGSPVPSTILVICYKKKVDKRKSFYKTLNKGQNTTVFLSDPLREWHLPDWIVDLVKKMGYGIEPKATQLLVDHLGADLQKVTNELEKLMLVIPKGETIGLEAIEKNVGISKDFNSFELQDALAEKNRKKANRIANFFAANSKEHPVVKELFGIYFFFSKLLIYKGLKRSGNGSLDKKKVASELKINPFFVSQYAKADKNYSGKEVVDVIHLLREFDLKSKGVDNVSAESPELIKELVRRIVYK